jgi:GNAT superfamily N-acetyltransferase
VTRYDLRAPSTAAEWRAYHDIRRTVLWDRRGKTEYDEHHPDETRAGNHPLILFVDDEPVGVLRLDVADRTAVVRRVAVDERRQRQGHGRAMLAMTEDFARARGCEAARSYVDADAVGFYERCGYARVEPESLEMTKALR